MSRNREHRFADARALRRALLAAAEAAWSRGGRIAASGPPGPVHIGDGAGLLSLPPAAPVPSFVAAGASPVAVPGLADAKGAKAKTPAAESAAWGDFVGLESPRIRDDNPPPSSSTPSFLPPKQQRLVAHANDPLLDLPSDSAPAPLFLDEGAGPAPGGGPPARARTSVPRKAPGERGNSPDVPPAVPPSAGAAPARGSKPRTRAEPAIPRDDFADMMNPLYAGQDRAAPEIDHDRMKVASPPRKTRGDRAIAAAGRAHTPPAREHRMVLLRPAMGAWLLPIAALIGVAYLLYEPELPTAPSAEQISNTLAGEIPAGAAEGAPAGASGVAHGRSRREQPGQAPAHMRDVLF